MLPEDHILTKNSVRIPSDKLIKKVLNKKLQQKLSARRQSGWKHMKRSLDEVNPKAKITLYKTKQPVES